MRIINHGNVLPLYPNLNSQMRFRCGCETANWAIPVAKGESLPFQFPVPVGQNSWTVTVYPETGAPIVVPMSLIYRETADGTKAWVTYTGNNSVINGLECGRYHIGLSNPGARISYYTEQFDVMDMGGRKKAYRVNFLHSTDIDGILYQTGYAQKFWLTNAVFDTPQIVEPVTNVTDGDGIEVPVFQSVQRREVLRFPYFPDFWHGTMHRLRMHSSVTLTDLVTNEVWQIGGQGIQVTTDDQDICFKLGQLSWIASTQVTTSCNNNYTLV